MKVLIPTIGTLLRLKKPWTFTLFNESRNYKLWEVFGKEAQEAANEELARLAKLTGRENDRYGYRYGRQSLTTTEVTFPAGTEIRVDRIYIRKGGDVYSSFDSITFWLTKTTHPAIVLAKGKGKAKAIRFWAKLYDVNNIDCEIVPDTTPPVRGIVHLMPDRVPGPVVKWLETERLTVDKTVKQGDHYVIFVEGPPKRYQTVFHGVLNHTKADGYSWEKVPPTDSLWVEQPNPDYDPRAIWSKKTINVKVEQHYLSCHPDIKSVEFQDVLETADA
jgi:hypothetical protein